MSDGWQPIETAPRDGTWFVTASFKDGEHPHYEIGCYDPTEWTDYVPVGDGLFRQEKREVYEWSGFNNFGRATHWCPLPPAPAEGD